MKRKRKKKDWNPDIEERADPFRPETVAEEMASLIHPRTRAQGYAAASIFGMLANDIEAEDAYAVRCPKCDHHTLVRLRPGDPKSPWQCNTCGNDADEFGNKL